MGWFMRVLRRLDAILASLFGATDETKFVQGLEIILVVLHKRLTDIFGRKFRGKEKAFADKVATAVLNELFSRGEGNPVSREFAGSNRGLIDDCLKALPHEAPRICKEITLALYVMEILAEGSGGPPGRSRSLFDRATGLGIFSPEVTIPQAKEFLQHALELARREGLLPEK